MAAQSAVFVLPPSESVSSRVSFESRKGTWLVPLPVGRRGVGAPW